jgi:hypothetical protein
MTSGDGTFIGSDLKMGIRILNNRQTKNSLGALSLLTDGQLNKSNDYTQLIQTLLEGIHILEVLHFLKRNHFIRMKNKQ